MSPPPDPAAILPRSAMVVTDSARVISFGTLVSEGIASEIPTAKGPGRADSGHEFRGPAMTVH